MEEHDESSLDDVSNALQSGNLTSLAAILQVCRDGKLHKNNKEEPFKGANNETTNQKKVDAHQKAHKSEQYPENHPLARIRRKRRRTNDRKSLADVIFTCRSEGKQAFHDVANVPESDLARIEELQREMGVDISNTKIHVSVAKLRRRQSKLSMSSSVSILTGTGSGSVVVVSATTSRDSSLPSTNKSSSQRTPRNSTSTSRMSEMSPAARDILLKQSLKQMNANAIKRQRSFLNVLSSLRADMQMIVSDLKSDIHIENTLAVEEDVEKKTPEDTLDKEPAVKDEDSDTESEADDKKEKHIVAEESDRESEADDKEEKHIVAKESDTESEADDKDDKNIIAEKSGSEFVADDKEEKHIVAEESDTESEADDKEEENIVARRGHKIDTDPNKEIIAHIKRTAKSNITSKWSPGHKRHKRPANENSSSISSGDDNSRVEQELRLLQQKEHLIKTSQASRVYEDEAISLNPTDYVFVGNEYDLSTKFYAVDKQFASKSSQNNVKHKNERQSKVEFDASEKKTVEQNTYNNRANITKSKKSLSRREQYNSDNNDTANSIKMARQSVDSGIVQANIPEDHRSTVKHETNRGRALKNRQLSGDHAERRQPSSVSTDSSLSELKRKPRKVNPGIDVASKIVDSRKQFYQNGTAHSAEIREHRIMKLFREIQRVRNVIVFPSSYDVIEDETSGFLMIDYDKQRRIDTFSDREAIDRFLYKPVQYELCCKVNGVSANFAVRRKH